MSGRNIIIEPHVHFLKTKLISVYPIHTYRTTQQTMEIFKFQKFSVQRMTLYTAEPLKKELKCEKMVL